MWPFKKKETKKPEVKKEPVIDYERIRVDTLREFRDIGEKFNYLGATIIVTGHCRFSHNYEMLASLQGDYRTENGEIKQIVFDYSELETLRNENQQPEKEQHETTD